MRGRTRSILSLLAIAGIGLLWVAQHAHARAGGGEGYGGGGGGGGFGGGGGDGDGIGVLIYLLVRLSIQYPAVGIPLLIIVVAFFLYSSHQGKNAYQGHVIRKGMHALDRHRQHDVLAQIQQRDPAFDDQQFFQRVGLAFQKIQHAWSQQDLSSVRPFISDGVHERFTLQIEQQKSFGWRNEMHQLQVHDIVAAQVNSDGLFDELTVRIDASAMDFRVSLQTGRRVAGNAHPEAFVEYWTFLRATGTQTRRSGAGLIEGNCPNCGGDIQLNQFANCAYCGALLRSGEYDWVLAEITQASEWQPAQRSRITGFEAIRSVDPQINLQHLEDRVSVMFWRLMMAEHRGDVAPLRKIARPEFAEAREQALRRGNERTFYADCAVGSVETRALMTTDGMHRGLVEVRWAGTMFVERDGRLQRTQRNTLARSLYVLERSAAARTQATRALSSAHCPNCGAPESDTASHTCDHCGQVLNDGRQDWVLADMVPMGSAQARQLLEQARDAGLPPIPLSDVPPLPADQDAFEGVQPTPSSLLAWTVSMVVADGEVDAREKKMLMPIAAKAKVGVKALEEMIALAHQGQLRVPEPETRDQARAWLASMAQVALSDGKIHGQESRVLRQLGSRIGLSDYDLRLILKAEKSRLYSQARNELQYERRNGNGR